MVRGQVVGTVAKVRLLTAATVVLLAAGCSSGASTPVTTPDAAPSSAASSAPAPAPDSAATCPDGAYLLTAFEGRGDTAAAGKGTGGDIKVDFASGTFRMTSDGAAPVKLDLGPSDADLRFDGEIDGRYEGESSALRLTPTAAQGDIRIKGFGVTRNFSVGDLADQLFGQGVTAQATCDEAAGTAVVVLPNASLTLARAGG